MSWSRERYCQLQESKKKTHFIFKANKTFFYDEYHIYHKTVTLYTLQISKQMKVQ